MDILFVTPSLTPFPVEAGPAETSAALAKALRNLGHRVSICAPYPDEPDAALTGLARRLDPLVIEIGGKTDHVNVHDGRSAAGIEWTLLEHPALFDLYEEGEAGLYAQAVLGRACTALLARERAFDAVHLHGEETALACAMIALEKRLSTVFSVYSLSTPLRFDADVADKYGLDPLIDNTGTLCPLLGAITLARRVSTTVPQRILDSERDSDVARALKARGGDLSAVLGGLDSSVWNPLTDSHLFARYTPLDLGGKSRNKAMLQSELKLEIDPDVALLGAVESGVGAARVEAIAQELVRTDVQLVVQVLDEDADCIDRLIALSERMPHRLKVRLGDSQMRAHRIIAASDALLLASDRPALAMAAQRYGTLPVARKHSTAAEVIVDLDPKLASGSGLLYDDRSHEAFLAGSRRAIAAFNRGGPFEKLRARLMRIDHSWERAARAFEHIYMQAADIIAA
ncbi:MAG: glycogen synthase [Pseudomonadota bacterium]|jgi:starch synthase